MSDTATKIIYGYLLVAFIPLGVLGARYGFATGDSRGVTLTEFTYGFVALSVVCVLAVGAIIEIWRRASRRDYTWPKIGVVAILAIAVVAPVVGYLTLGVDWDIVRSLTVGLFWFATAAYVLSLGEVVLAIRYED